MRFNRLFSSGVVIVLTNLVNLWAQAPAQPAAEPAAVKPAQNQPVIRVPESYVERMRRQGNVLDLGLKDAIRLALTNNLEIAIEDYNEDLNRERIIGTKGFYDPKLTFQIGWRNQDRPSTSILDAGRGIPITTTKNLLFNSQFDQNVPGGGALSLSFDNNRFATNSIFSFMNPNFGSVLELAFTQPLWRGFRQTQTERQLKLYNLDSKISDSQFKDKVSSIIQLVQNQYWELVFAIENHETRRQSMELALVQHRNNEKRVEIGVMAPIEITKSRAAVATREQDMIQSEVAIIEAQNSLKRMLAPDPKASMWSLHLLPTDRPTMQELQVTMEDCIGKALERRPELEQIRLQMEKSAVDKRYYSKQGKPAVNLVASVTSTGQAGRIVSDDYQDTNGDGIPDTSMGQVEMSDHPFYGAFGNSMKQAFGFDYRAYNVFLNVELPLRNRTNEADLAQLAINDRRLASQMKNTQQLVIVDVRNAFESIQTRKQGLEAARVARQLSEEQLAGENKRFEAGLSTNFEVLTYQQDLADAQVRELRALIDYQRALTALQKAMYTMVDENDIVVARGQTAQQP
jgi:HAE1 family hydrophobic/amphiphilic exporter-1